ncbi:hypothetical protein SMJ63A_80019 [Stenotrophomonas geniculata]
MVFACLHCALIHVVLQLAVRSADRYTNRRFNLVLGISDHPPELFEATGDFFNFNAVQFTHR